MHWIKTLIEKYKEALAFIEGKDKTYVLHYLSSVNLAGGICHYLEAEKIALSKMIQVNDYSPKQSEAYYELQSYMGQMSKPYLTALPRLCHSTEDIKDSIRIRLQHLYKMEEMFCTTEFKPIAEAETIS